MGSRASHKALGAHLENYFRFVREADLKLAVTEYLQILQNQGKLVYLRLNAGDFIEVRGDTRRRVRGCPKGTADFVVISNCWFCEPCIYSHTEVKFIELKSAKGKQSKEQVEFQKMVEMQGAKYYIIRNIEELSEVIDG